jgi:hypothetical protein
MGIDLYLRWIGQTPEELAAQEAAWLISNGSVGYLRESFSGGPYATKILAREAFESPTEQAEIRAAILRERLISVTEPARGYALGGGDWVVQTITEALECSGAFVEKPRPPHTDPQSVEEAIQARYADDPKAMAHALKAFRDFVALAEQKEQETGRACTVVVEC